MATLPPPPAKPSLPNHGFLPAPRIASLLHASPPDLPSVAALDQDDHSNETSPVQDKERLRRQRIGHANKGRTPWNKGKKHSPATIALMKERNSKIMQDPKIREKLRQHSHPQSEETREKIRIYMKGRMEIQRRQLSCVEEWKETIAETARLGDFGDEELQWGSYKILKEELRREHCTAMKENQKREKVATARTWTLEQRLKISESVRARWEDPIYRQKVSTGMCDSHRRRGFQAERRSDYAILLDEMEQSFVNTNDLSFGRCTKPQSLNQVGLVNGMPTVREPIGNKTGSYYDPLANAKLERVKQLRVQSMKDKEQLLRTSTETDEHGKNGLVLLGAAKEARAVRQVESEAVEQARREATERARVLLAEAERAALIAAKALEAAGTEDEGVKFSLLQARTLLDEANHSIKSVEAGTLSVK